jgi:hypothetical protein
VIAVANRYASHQLKGSFLRASADLVVACAPMTSLVTGLGLGAAGYLVNAPGLAASGAVVAGAGLYVERMQARALRRRRRAERMRNRHEVTELRRTIAQLRIEVDAFQRALIDTEAAYAHLAHPAPVAASPAPVVAVAAAAPVVAPAAPEPVVAAPVASSVPAVPALVAPVVPAVPAAVASALPAVPAVEGWFQTAERDAAESAPLPAQQPSPFVEAASGSLPVLPELPPRRTYDTGGIPVLDAAPRDRLSETTDALVHAALAGLDGGAEREVRPA